VSKPALALIECSSIAVGTRATDALIKKAPVTIDRVGTLQPGKFAVLFSGDVASVEESFGEGLRVGGDAVDDRVFLPHVDPSVYDAVVHRKVASWTGDTIGVIETSTLAAVIEGADAAVKGANVRVVEIRLADGLGGKGLAHLAGDQADVEAAVDIAGGRIISARRQLWISVTPRFDDELRQLLQVSSTAFAGTGRGG